MASAPAAQAPPQAHPTSNVVSSNPSGPVTKASQAPPSSSSGETKTTDPGDALPVEVDEKSYLNLYHEVFKDWTMAQTINWHGEAENLDHIRLIQREPFLRLFASRTQPLPRCQDMQRLHPELFCTLGEVKDPLTVAFVSHRWETPRQPDPRGAQLQKTVRLLQALPKLEYVFYDYWVLPQRDLEGNDDRTDEQKAYFTRVLHAGLKHLNLRTTLVPLWNCDQAPEDALGGDYLERAWCFAELMWGRDHMEIVEGLNEVGQDLQTRIDQQFAEFLGRVM